MMVTGMRLPTQGWPRCALLGTPSLTRGCSTQLAILECPKVPRDTSTSQLLPPLASVAWWCAPATWPSCWASWFLGTVHMTRHVRMATWYGALECLKLRPLPSSCTTRTREDAHCRRPHRRWAPLAPPRPLQLHLHHPLHLHPHALRHPLHLARQLPLRTDLPPLTRHPSLSLGPATSNHHDRQSRAREEMPLGRAAHLHPLLTHHPTILSSVPRNGPHLAQKVSQTPNPPPGLPFPCNDHAHLHQTFHLPGQRLRMGNRGLRDLQG